MGKRRCEKCGRQYPVKKTNWLRPCPFCNAKQTGNYPKWAADDATVLWLCMDWARAGALVSRLWTVGAAGAAVLMSRLTDLIQRYADRHQPIDLRLLDTVIRQERLTGSLTLHYKNGEPKLLEAGKPIVVEVEPSCPFDTPAETISVASGLTNRRL